MSPTSYQTAPPRGVPEKLPTPVLPGQLTPHCRYPSADCTHFPSAANSATEVTVHHLPRPQDSDLVEVHFPLEVDADSGNIRSEPVLAVAVAPDTYFILEVPQWSSDANLGDRVIALPTDADVLEFVEVVTRRTVARIVFHPLGDQVFKVLPAVAERNHAIYDIAPCGCVVANLFDPSKVASFERFAERNSQWHSRWDYPSGLEGAHGLLPPPLSA